MGSVRSVGTGRPTPRRQERSSGERRFEGSRIREGCERRVGLPRRAYSLGPGMVLSVDQALFGYDDGHRMLAHSAPLTREAVRALLGATDTPARDRRLLTAMPLRDSAQYAICSTWPAPEQQ